MEHNYWFCCIGFKFLPPRMIITLVFFCPHISLLTFTLNPWKQASFHWIMSFPSLDEVAFSKCEFFFFFFFGLSLWYKEKGLMISWYLLHTVSTLILIPYCGWIFMLTETSRMLKRDPASAAEITEVVPSAISSHQAGCGLRCWK